MSHTGDKSFTALPFPIFCYGLLPPQWKRSKVLIVYKMCLLWPLFCFWTFLPIKRFFLFYLKIKFDCTEMGTLSGGGGKGHTVLWAASGLFLIESILPPRFVLGKENWGGIIRLSIIEDDQTMTCIRMRRWWMICFVLYFIFTDGQ